MKVMKTALLFLILIVCISCSYLPSDPEYLELDNYRETTEYIILSAENPQTESAFLFLPGGFVDAHAYVSVMQKVADKGISVIIPKFSANLGMTELTKPSKIIEDMPAIKRWYTGGHSLGGIVAQISVFNHPELFEGLVFLGVYPAENYSLSDWTRNVLSIYSSNDGLSTVSKIESTKELLPEEFNLSPIEILDTLHLNEPSTLFYLIQGGNHSQFGNYGLQNNDHVADITREEQHATVSDAIVKFILWNENR